MPNYLVHVLDILARDGLIERRRDELGEGEEEMLTDLSDAEIEVMLDYFARIDRRMSDLAQSDRPNAV